MRRLFGRILGLGFLLAVLMGSDPPHMLPPPTTTKTPPPLAPAPFPPVPTIANPAHLRSDTEALAHERDEATKSAGSSSTTERAIVRAQLLDLLKRINDKQSTPSLPPHSASPPPKEKFNLEGSRPVDVVRMAENLFRSGDTFAALQAFRSVDQEVIPREDRLFVQYMTACCLRKMNKRAEAAALYREVAEAKDVDEILSGCAISQLSMIRRTQDLEAQLEQLQSRPKSR